MNTHEDDRDERLLEDYRRASDAEAGRPADATRKAILQGARAAVRDRQPAANDSRYAWSAAAGIAVLGIALLLWRQADPQLVATVPSSPAPERELSEEPAESRRKAEVEAEVAADTTLARAAPADESASKLRDHFPEAWVSSSPPAVVWIVEDARGDPLRQGTLAAGEPLPTLQPPVLSQSARSTNVGAAAGDAAGNLRSETTGWTLQTAVNNAGVSVQIATARETLLAPASTAESDR